MKKAKTFFSYENADTFSYKNNGRLDHNGDGTYTVVYTPKFKPEITIKE